MNDSVHCVAISISNFNSLIRQTSHCSITRDYLILNDSQLLSKIYSLSAISFLLASNHSHEWILKLTFPISTFKIQIREIFERSCLSVCQYKMKHVRILYLISLRILKRYFESIYTPFPVRIISNNSNLIDFDVKVSRYRNITIHWQILSDVSMRIQWCVCYSIRIAERLLRDCSSITFSRVSREKWIPSELNSLLYSSW